MTRYFVFTFFIILSFGWLINSHDYDQYFLHFAEFHTLEFNQYSSISGFITWLGFSLSVYEYILSFLILYLKSADEFVYLLWLTNWLSIFYFFIYKNKFNTWFILTYLIVFSYLWHSNQLRQGIIVPIILHLYYNRQTILNKKILLFTIILSSWHLASLICLTYIKNLISFKEKYFYLIYLFLFFSLIMGGRVTLINVSSIIVLILLIVSFKIKSNSFNLPLTFFLAFLLLRSYGDGILASRMLELSCLILPMILYKKRSIPFNLAVVVLALILTLNNFVQLW